MTSCTVALIESAKSGNEADRADVIASLDGMVRSIASAQLKATPKGNELEDLVQEGYMAAIEALDAYTPGKAKFSTFAHKRISGAVTDAAFRAGTSGINLDQLKTYRSALGRTGGDHEAAAEIVTDSDQVGKRAMSAASVSDVRAAMTPLADVMDLGEDAHPIAWAETEDFELAPELRDESDTERSHRKARVELAHAVLATLPVGSIAVLELAYGLNGKARMVHMDPNSPQFGQPDAEAIAAELGISASGVRSNIQRAHERLEKAGQAPEFTTLPLELADLYRADQLRPEPRSNRPVEKRPAGRHSGPTAERYSGGFACSGRTYPPRDAYGRA
ncbi:sigma-70 family RNA polymerase sigma factor [Kitasatospora purpeofusca]|uniref:sigma-70 family RNA polymerase sigma factor n=1 Tax=Kitasatospora purpeofusca TaxID=67352 RepID=UPI00369DA522